MAKSCRDKEQRPMNPTSVGRPLIGAGVLELEQPPPLVHVGAGVAQEEDLVGSSWIIEAACRGSGCRRDVSVSGGLELKETFKTQSRALGTLKHDLQVSCYCEDASVTNSALALTWP